MPSFDTVLKADAVELRNAVEQTNKEISGSTNGDAPAQRPSLQSEPAAASKPQFGLAQPQVTASSRRPTRLDSHRLCHRQELLRQFGTDI